jgi:hypothetical protein
MKDNDKQNEEKIMVKKLMLAATLLTLPMVMSSPVEAKDKEYCREYTKTIYVGGHQERAYGTACYKPDGSWEIVSLEGDHHARHEVREVIYKDIHKKKHRRGGKTVIISNKKHPHSYYHSPRYYSSHHKIIHHGSPSFSWAYYGRDHHDCKSKHHRHR